MKILALDTATENCSAALLIDGALIGREALLARGQSERILPMVQEVLAEGGVSLAGLTAIAFGRGPGAFTGVRLAASITQGLAFGAGLPVIPVSDLRALALRAFYEVPGTSRALVCTDARMGEVYCGACEHTLADPAAPAAAEAVLAPGRVSLPASWDSGPAPLLAGSGFAAYPDLERNLRRGGSQVRPALWPRAHEVATLAVREAHAGRMLPPEAAVPVYLRDDVAQPPRASY
ncbi:MAG: tRNA (adenosine(37)-N6)-threonylcarbamoyltransferase complex dimerization subunit type 1 TsaB [Proteobacteria bacterium]|nr:tRNA (adenosine(37)-N6)-threonylcarbamoyltransferase complex dimerization subunit type 1 TsaB [Pseudomonadota bacterium]